MVSSVRIIAVLIVALFCVMASADDFSEPQMAELRAEFIDPQSEQFSHSSLRHSFERSGPCTCPSVFTNTYVGAAFPSQLITALEYAQCLWSCILVNVPSTIKVQVNNIQTSGNVLASAGPYFTSTNGQLFTPCALSGSQCDIAIKMNIDPDAVSYYFGTDGYVGYTQYDFVSVVMHELTHGLGFCGFINPSTGGYSLSSPQYVAFDRKVQYGQQYPWITNPPASASVAATAVTSNALYFQGNVFRGRLYAPNSAQPGSSIYHWDETTYPKGDPDSLMTPVISNGEANHQPGQMACDVLQSLGYTIPDLSVCGSAPAGTTSSKTPTPSVSFSSSSSISRSASQASASRTPSLSPSSTMTPSATVSASMSGQCPCVCTCP